jgi:hypothetical protein
LRYKRQRGRCLIGSETVVQNSRDICDSTPGYRKTGTGQRPAQKRNRGWNSKSAQSGSYLDLGR